MRARKWLTIVVVSVGFWMLPAMARADWVRYGRGVVVVHGRAPVVIQCDDCRVHGPWPRWRSHVRWHQHRKWMKRHHHWRHGGGDGFFLGASIHSPGLTVIFRSRD
ncbi:hypothetical protein SAMN02746041_01600 [Desulfacinum hydrothermale DSM 13146]|uniref:Uncharacterized protein n=1 Tax=Desulfacinum hydrothermale DSM 13146 TaxID=1121390 RepID=A0A1W1XHH4_9BACT|nr:hypothetical protein SAMN02746041_01600 [Desulfacinum hydrothermale DSM 13146]